MNHPSLSALLAQLTPFRLLPAALYSEGENPDHILRIDNQYAGIFLIVILIFLALVLIVGVLIFYLAVSSRRTHMTIPGRILCLLAGTTTILISLRLIYHVILANSFIQTNEYEAPAAELTTPRHPHRADARAAGGSWKASAHPIHTRRERPGGSDPGHTRDRRGGTA